jgi:hypothetical protein
LKPCPCSEGVIVGDLKNKESIPKIVCSYCEEVYCFQWFLCWDGWEGNYWYQWKIQLSP